MATKDREQLSVPVDAELKAAIDRAAKAEHRTMANLVRHIVAQALENQQVAA
jgi:predicted transcriptional regulator